MIAKALWVKKVNVRNVCVGDKIIVNRNGEKILVVSNKSVDEILEIDGVENLCILIDMEEDKDKEDYWLMKMDEVIREYYNVDKVEYRWWM